MEYKCKICQNFQSESDCSHIFHMGENEFSITNIFSKEGNSKLFVKDLNCICLKETYYTNKFELCISCLTNTIEFFCLECNLSFCNECIRLKKHQENNHERYSSIWKERKCQLEIDSKSHILIHYNFNRTQNLFYFLFKNLIEICEKENFLKIFKLKNIDSITKEKLNIEVLSNSYFDYIKNNRVIKNDQLWNTIIHCCKNLELKINKEIRLFEDELKIKFDFKKLFIEDEVKYDIIFLNRKKIKFLIMKKEKAFMIEISENKVRLNNYSKDFNDVIGVIKKNENQISVLIQYTIQNQINPINNINSFEIIDYNHENDDYLKKTNSRKFNINTSLLNNSSKKYINSNSISLFLNLSKKLIIGNYSGNYLICNFDYKKFKTIEIYCLNQDNKYNLIKIMIFINRVKLLSLIEVSKNPYFILAFQSKIEIYNIPKCEIIFNLNTLDMIFKIIQCEYDYYLCDAHQIYILKEEKNCLLNTNILFEKEGVLDLIISKEYIIIFTNSLNLKVYFKYDVIYLNSIKLEYIPLKINYYNDDEKEMLIILLEEVIVFKKINGISEIGNYIINTNNNKYNILYFN